VSERDWQRGLASQPAVRDDPHKVLGRQRVVDWDGEGERVVLLGELGLEQKNLGVQDVLLVHVLNENVERFRVSVHLWTGNRGICIYISISL